MSYLIPQVSKDKESDVQGFVAAIKRIKDAHEMTEIEALRAEIEALKQQVEQGKRDAVPEGLFIIDGGFKRNGTEATPTLLIGFNDNDYDARDSFRNWIRAAAPKQEK